MLTQGSAPDPKCKLNISSFLTLLHLSDNLLTSFCFSFSFLFFFVSLVPQSFVLSCPVPLFEVTIQLQLLCQFLCFLFLFFLSGPFNQELLVHTNFCVYHVKLFKKSVSGHYSVDFLGKMKLCKLESLFKVYTILYTSSFDFQVEFRASAF